ncbi:hypothetical protein [Candidatus Amarobacter glycogenicus]|uniref:hypothetical protein n=1 Tax=Candidatus Amarobacter glycogenicus TaxID=3140699 RepID=UPI002A0F8D8A|nr:hypothetical protein [Dehalococcoidia bacterium]
MQDPGLLVCPGTAPQRAGGRGESIADIGHITTYYAGWLSSIGTHGMAMPRD